MYCEKDKNNQVKPEFGLYQKQSSRWPVKCIESSKGFMQGHSGPRFKVFFNWKLNYEAQRLESLVSQIVWGNLRNGLFFDGLTFCCL